MKNLISGIAACLAVLVVPAAAQATFSLDKASYQVGETVVATWSGSASSTDWVGIYPRGVIPDGDPVSTAWSYASAAAGSASFVTPTRFGAGQWTAWLLANDGYGVVDGTAPVDFEVVDPTPSITLFAADTNLSLSPGSPVTLTWDVANQDNVTSLTLDDGTSAPVDVLGLTSYEVSPTTNTTYTLDLDNGTETATRFIMVAAESSAALALSSTTMTTDDVLTVSWEGAAAGPTDWIGIYKVGDTPGNQNSTQWNYLTGTQTSGPGPADGSMEFTGLAEGQYFVALLLNDGYEIAEGPVLFTVTPPTEEIIPVTSVVRSGCDLTLTWRSKAGHEYDIFASDTLDGDPELDWDIVVRFLPSEGDGTTSYTENLGLTPPARRFYRVYEFPTAP